MEQEFIICGDEARPNAEMAWCSRCHRSIWPTKGTVRAAREDGAELICIDCYPGIGNHGFGGFSHHGIRMPDATVEQILELLERDQRRFR